MTLAVISSSAYIVAVRFNTPSIRAGASAVTIASFTASPNPVYVGDEVTFWANASSDTGSSLTFTIFYDYYLPPVPTLNPESGVSVNHTGNPGNVVQTFTYNDFGNFTAVDGLTYFFVRLFVDDGSNNFSAFITLKVKVNAAPQFKVAPYNLDLWPEVVGEPVDVYVQVVDPDSDPIDVFWEFGDGGVATNHTDGTLADSYANQTHSWCPYVAPGTGDFSVEYQMNVTIVDVWGSSATASALITVHVPENSGPTITITSSSTKIQPGESVTFYGSARDPEGEPLTWTFNYSDGTTEVFHTDWTEPSELVWCNVTHVFEDAGIYTITMYVSDALPGSQVFPHNVSASAPSLTVAINRVPIVWSIGAVPSYPIINSLIGFVNVTLSVDALDEDGDVLTVSWYIGGSTDPVVNTSGGGTSIYKFIQVFTVTETGSYNVTVVVTDGFEGHEVTVSGVINVTSDNRPPILVEVDFAYSAELGTFALVGDLLDFELTFSDREQDAIEIVIDPGDGTPKVNAVLTEYVFGNVTYVFSHAYSYADDFVMTINFTDNEVGLYDHEKSFTIDPIRVIEDDTPPIADAGQNQTVDAGTLVTFDGSVSSDNIGIANYSWTLVDGTEKELYGVGPTYTFGDSGAYTVTLDVTDYGDNHDTDTVVITVLGVNELPVADAGTNQTVTVGEEVTFDGSGSSDDVGIENYTWTFTYDDEVRELYGVSPEFTFDIAGTYIVTLTVEDAEDETDTDTVKIIVEEEQEEDGKSFLESYGLPLGIVVVLAIIALILFFVLRGRKEGEAPTSLGEPPETEPESND